MEGVGCEWPSWTIRRVWQGADGTQDLMIVRGNAGHEVRQQQHREDHPYSACQGEHPSGNMPRRCMRGQRRGLCAGRRYHLLSSCLSWVNHSDKAKVSTTTV